MTGKHLLTDLTGGFGDIDEIPFTPIEKCGKRKTGKCIVQHHPAAIFSRFKPRKYPNEGILQQSGMATQGECV